MNCYVCARNATHRIYADLKPICGKHLVEAVDEEDGDLVISTIDGVVDAVYTPLPRIEEIKAELDIIKAKKDALNEVTLELITSTNPVASAMEVQNKYSKQQDALFTEWKKLSEENYQLFQKWFDGLQMGVK